LRALGVSGVTFFMYAQSQQKRQWVGPDKFTLPWAIDDYYSFARLYGYWCCLWLSVNFQLYRDYHTHWGIKDRI